MNILTLDKKLAVLNTLLEGNSVRATSRLTGVHKATILKLLVATGERCEAILNDRMRDLRCEAIEADELWCFIGKKQRNLSEEESQNPELGDQYTFIAFDPDTKLVPVFTLGKRSHATTRTFINELRARVTSRIQLSTDGWRAYPPAISDAFGADVDYAQIEKFYVNEYSGGGRYSPPRVSGIEKRPMFGNPRDERICTSYVERHNLTVRMQVRRFTRLTNGFSRKFTNLKAALALYFAHYNFCRIHGTLRTTPAMAAAVTDRVWDLAELLAA